MKITEKMYKSYNNVQNILTWSFFIISLLSVWSSCNSQELYEDNEYGK